MVYIEPRAAWGARHRDGDINVYGLAAEVYAHHTVTAHLPATATAAQERAQMLVIEQIGFDRFGVGISYNVIVFPSGRAYQGVSFNRRGTHTEGRNSSARSICFAGNYETAAPTAAQLATAAAIYAEGKGRWWTPTAPLRGHRDVKDTSCPGRHVYARLRDIASGATLGVTAPTPIAPLPVPQRRRTVYVIKGADKPHNYLTDGLTKRYIGTPTERGELLRLCGQDRPYRTHPDADESPAGPLVIGQYACDRIPDWQPEGTVDVGAIADAVAAKVTPGHVNPETVAAAVADVLAHRLTNGA